MNRKEMFENLIPNKKWILSGIGIVTIFAILLIFRSFLFDSDNRDQGIHAEAPQDLDEAKRLLSPVTLDEFINILKNENITELQRQDFIKKHVGHIVRWQGIVANVEQMFSTDKKGDILVVYRPVSQKDESLPDFFTASFPFAATKDLLSLYEGDYIEFEGKLRILSPETNPFPSLENCVLLKHERAKDFKKP